MRFARAWWRPPKASWAVKPSGARPIFIRMSAPAANNPSASAPGVLAPPARGTYGQILKSSAIIGGAQMVDVLAAMVRVKIMAVLLGPAGFGLMGLFTSIADLTRSVAGMGLNASGVRQIAEAVGSGDRRRVAVTAAVLRRTAVVLGLAGGVFLIVFCRPISRLTFGTEAYALPVALLSLVVLIRVAMEGLGAILQGTRRIADMARCAVISSILSVGIAAPLIYFFREQGVVPLLVLVAAVSCALTWWYARRAGIGRVSVTAGEVAAEARVLLRLGTAFMASGLLTMGAGYVIRLIVLHHHENPGDGLRAAGYYGAAWALGGLYIGMILQAMGADFYPRLTAVAKDNAECNRLVNEQAEVGLLLAGPGLLGTMTLAPLILTVFYSPEFEAAVTLLRWLCLGMMLRVISWPMGTIVLAKGRPKPFFWSEAAWAAVHVGLAWLLVGWTGLNGAGMAFFGSYLCHVALVFFIVRRMSGFAWSAANLRLGLLFLPAVGLVFAAFQWLPFWWATALGLGTTAGAGIFALRRMARLVSPDRMPRAARRMLEWLRLLPRTA